MTPNALESLTENLSEHFSPENLGELYRRGQEVADDVIKQGKDFYDNLEANLPEGSLKVAQYALAGLAVGYLGYRIGKSRGRRVSLSGRLAGQAEDKAQATQQAIHQGVTSATRAVSNVDFSPVYKLAKLWMLYRISV